MDTNSSVNSMAGKVSPLSDKAKNISENNSNDGDDAPDNDAIKMFVGQVPRSMDEDDLKQFFEDFGPVHQLNVLRDKSTGVSRGCCFVTFYKRKHALDAQNALHNIRTMQGMHHPIQMKPADTENRNERKIFVGMVCKKLNEEDIKSMFLQFGPIEECTVLRDDNGTSRGCAFVTFSNRQVAMVAIKAMHHSVTMEGCSSPLVVKFADTQKEKEQKKVQQIQTNLWGLASPGVSPGYVQVGQVPSPSPNIGGGLLGTPLTLGGGGQLGNQVSQLLSLQQLLSGQYMVTGTPGISMSQHPVVLGQHCVPPAEQVQGVQGPDQDLVHYDQQQRALAYLQSGLVNTGSFQPNLSMHPFLTMGQMCSPVMTTSTSLHQDTSLSTSSCVPFIQTQISSIPSLHNQVPHITSVKTSSTADVGSIVTGSKMKTPDGSYKPNSGPEGANLFIYHLPQEFSDSDLTQTFQPFGTIVSAKVFIDKHTNLSKCFGFVSYTSNESAHAAIQAMNGFQIGTKRLKVQIKKPKDASKPY